MLDQRFEWPHITGVRSLLRSIGVVSDDLSLFGDDAPSVPAKPAATVTTIAEWQIDLLRKALDARGLTTMVDCQTGHRLSGRPCGRVAASPDATMRPCGFSLNWVRLQHPIDAQRQHGMTAMRTRGSIGCSPAISLSAVRCWRAIVRVGGHDFGPRPRRRCRRLRTGASGGPPTGCLSRARAALVHGGAAGQHASRLALYRIQRPRLQQPRTAVTASAEPLSCALEGCLGDATPTPHACPLRTEDAGPASAAV